MRMFLSYTIASVVPQQEAAGSQIHKGNARQYNISFFTSQSRGKSDNLILPLRHE
jgi:hypothetical protein